LPAGALADIVEMMMPAWSAITPKLVNRAELHAAIGLNMRRLRRRNGAFMWELFQDIEDPGRMVDSFMVESWLEHLRQDDHGQPDPLKGSGRY